MIRDEITDTFEITEGVRLDFENIRLIVKNFETDERKKK